MLTKLKTVVFRVLLLLPLGGYAQEKKDSVTTLQEVVIEQSRLGSYAIRKYTLKVDSFTHQLAGSGSLADLMRKFGYGHLRSYGPGGLATASFRGTGSSHTAVLWNGINLLSPLNGQLDLSHVPISFIDDASVQTGGTASLYGNGSIGGTIQLNNKARFNEGLVLKSFSNAGSFGSLFQDLGVTWSGKKFISSTKVFLNKAENNFTYQNNYAFPVAEETRDHAALQQRGILQQNYWQLSPQHLFTFKFWYQDNTYEVPNPTFVPRKSVATEQNTFYRTVLGWHYNHELFDLNYQGAFIKHDLEFNDSLTNTFSKNTFNTIINNLEGNFSLARNTAMTTGLNYAWEQGQVDAFGNSVPERNRTAIFSAIKWAPHTQWETSVAFREEIINGNASPFAPSLIVKLKPSANFEAFGSTARNYRIPTFNDLYWKGAGGFGDPDLKTETSFSNEVGFNFTSPTNSSGTSASFKGALFTNNVDNWIQWIPVTSSTSTPRNIKKVWSRGIETQASFRSEIGHAIVEVFMQYTFTRSTNQEVYESANQNELGKQLIFTPQHEGSITGRVSWNGYCLNAVSSYVGKQYTDGDNDEFYALKAYSVTSLWLNKLIAVRHLKATLVGEVNNIFNTYYQSRPGYPMPGINFKLGLTIQFNQTSI